MCKTHNNKCTFMRYPRCAHVILTGSIIKVSNICTCKYEYIANRACTVICI